MSKSALKPQCRQCENICKGLRLVGQMRDEIFLLLHSALQLHYLKVAICSNKLDKKAETIQVYNASFTENFYGLQRAPDDER